MSSRKIPIMPENPSVETLPKPKSETGDTLRTVLVAVLLAMLFRSLIFQPFTIPSGSMKGNLLIGDYLFVSKFSYGYSRYSFPLGLNLFEGRIGGDAPSRGDVVVFRQPPHPDVDFIKRVIGLPGDRIQMIHGVLHINGAAIPKKRIDDFKEYDAASRTFRSIPQYEETLPEGKVIQVLDEVEENPDPRTDNTIEYVVPPKHYFMMGDNRDNSADSRFFDTVGYVPEENLVGRARLILFSTDGFPSFRLGRFLNVIR